MACEVRAKYWIIGERSLVKAVIHKCVICRRFEGRPFCPPPAPPLPSFRVTEAPLFTYTAIDFAGPMYVGREKGEEGNKVYGFVCSHVVLHELSTLSL